MTCSVRAATPILSLLQARGIGLDTVAERLGIAPSVLTDSDARLPVARLLLPLWYLAEEWLDDPLVGLHAVQGISRGSFDVFSYIAAASPTLGEAAARVIRYFRLITDGGLYSIEHVGNDVWWHYRPADAATAACRQDSIFALTAVVAHLRLWLDEAFSPSEVRYPFPTELAELEAFFGTEVRINADRCAIRFDASLLERPQQLADPQLAAFLERYAEGALATLPTTGRVSTRVREILAQGLKDGELSLKSVAKTLGMSERSLQRQLSTENTTLKRITEELRRELATTYLKRHDLCVSDVAYMLGFSETAPFFRAFKKWTGLTPGDFRRGLRTHDCPSG
ncbi:MAG TPA: AraC family transcriptional regulator [Polyangiaceae bacterium]|nr:AraC family transcriptional regulator [Polyangiaceae bacterium]